MIGSSEARRHGGHHDGDEVPLLRNGSWQI